MANAPRFSNVMAKELVVQTKCAKVLQDNLKMHGITTMSPKPNPETAVTRITLTKTGIVMETGYAVMWDSATERQDDWFVSNTPYFKQVLNYSIHFGLLYITTTLPCSMQKQGVALKKSTLRIKLQNNGLNYPLKAKNAMIFAS
jgi:hypothetical protein